MKASQVLIGDLFRYHGKLLRRVSFRQHPTKVADDSGLDCIVAMIGNDVILIMADKQVEPGPPAPNNPLLYDALQFRVNHGNWADYPDHPREAWRDEVAADNTTLGYWEWVCHQIEEAGS